MAISQSAGGTEGPGGDANGKPTPPVLPPVSVPVPVLVEVVLLPLPLVVAAVAPTLLWLHEHMLFASVCTGLVAELLLPPVTLLCQDDAVASLLVVVPDEGYTALEAPALLNPAAPNELRTVQHAAAADDTAPAAVTEP